MTCGTAAQGAGRSRNTPCTSGDEDDKQRLQRVEKRLEKRVSTCFNVFVGVDILCEILSFAG